MNKRKEFEGMAWRFRNAKTDVVQKPDAPRDRLEKMWQFVEQYAIEGRQEEVKRLASTFEKQIKETFDKGHEAGYIKGRLKPYQVS